MAAPFFSLANDCYPGEQEVDFTLFLDEDSDKEQGWNMQCDGQTIWEVPVGILQETNMHRERMHRNWVRDTACIPETATCDFTLEDSYGDGMYNPGYFYLRYGTTTIATYDNEPFHEKSFCFGPDCPDLPQELAETCDLVYFFLKYDSHPEDNSFKVECDTAGVILEGSGLDDAAFNETEFQTCIEPFSCCTLTITDSESDGMTSTDGEFYGSAYVEWANQRIFAYDGSSGYEFGNVSIDFGLGC